MAVLLGSNLEPLRTAPVSFPRVNQDISRYGGDLTANKENKERDNSVLEDKQKFEQSEASEKLAHMGNKPKQSSEDKTKTTKR